MPGDVGLGIVQRLVLQEGLELGLRLATQAGLGPAYNVVEGYEGATASEAGWAGTGLPVARWDGEQA